ncbi:MAG: hypothetical protein V2I34_05760 [Bacteroidales bacterium]|nr:hypothetical protein [Bacteroidales bacterium]
MRYTVISLYSLLVILTGLCGCKETNLRSFEEGEIHYKIIFHDRNAILPDELMPNSMIVKFKDDKTLMEISSPVGNNGVFIITEPEKNQSKTFLKVLGMSYYYEGTAGEIPPGIDPMKGMSVEFTGKVSSILDLKCNKAIIRIPEKDFTYDIWYTEELKITRPNDSTPFKEIDGVLMNFFFLMGDIMVEFQAEGIYERPIPDKVFDRGDDFRRIDRSSMDRLITSMMNL